MFIGVDVGGTNTDAVLMDGANMVGAAKLPTTADVTSGIIDALTELLAQLPCGKRVDAVMVGTTHFTNALLEQRETWRQLPLCGWRCPPRSCSCRRVRREDHRLRG